MIPVVYYNLDDTEPVCYVSVTVAYLRLFQEGDVTKIVFLSLLKIHDNTINLL